MSLLDRLLTLSLLDINNALSQVENLEQVRDAVLNEVSGALEAAGAELRQLQRSRDSALQNRRAAEKEVDDKQLALNSAAEAEKEALKKQVAALQDALVRMDEQIAEQNREEATMHKQVARLQEIRREAAEWSPRRKPEPKAEPKVEPKATPASQTTTQQAKSSAASAPPSAQPSNSAQAQPQGQSATPKSAPTEDSNDPFIKMKRLKERMEEFQSRAAINEEELRAFETEKAIAEEETRRIIEDNLRELKRKMNQG